mmetsp:Transcript_28116/g.61685  ORF Transcript_28116/g.61685 Transcript_28116/m.61685 type:complete len:82 (+) Transcript_28116:804-1049(+)
MSNQVTRQEGTICCSSSTRHPLVQQRQAPGTFIMQQHPVLSCTAGPGTMFCSSSSCATASTLVQSHGGGSHALVTSILAPR